MVNKIQNKAIKTVNAYLVKNISYIKDGTEIVVQNDTLIMVDLIRGIALINEDHVDIFPDEYQVLVA